MDRPLVSVVVCTFNRADLLRRNLHALLRQAVEPDCYEIIVVDNNSTDDTEETVRGLAKGHVSVRYVLEPKQGVAHARNAGLHASRGSTVAYVDDDSFASPGWLRIILDSFDRVQPTPHVVGGPLMPLLLDRRHAWYRDRYDTFSWGSAPRFLGRDEYLYGANVAFARETLLEAGGFVTELGMKGGNLGYFEDTEVFERLWEHCGRLRCYYVPGAVVLHSVPESRVRPAFRLKREFAVGQGELRRDRLSGNARSRRRLLALYRLVQAFAGTVVFPDRLPDYGNWVINCSLVMAYRLGYLAGTLGLRVPMRRPR